MPRILYSQLLDAGDDAARRHDLGALARIAVALSYRTGDPLRDRLVDLAQHCRDGGPGTCGGWPALRRAIIDRIETAGT